MSWEGRSLSFVRQVSGEPPRYADCNQAMEEMFVEHNDEPVVGAWVWYKTESPHGNVALSLGHRQVLAVHTNGGHPYVTSVFDPRLGTYFGWSDPNVY